MTTPPAIRAGPEKGRGPPPGHRLRGGPAPGGQRADPDRRPGRDPPRHEPRAGPAPSGADRPPNRHRLARHDRGHERDIRGAVKARLGAGPGTTRTAQPTPRKTMT